jgi:hypothetical protein
VAILIQHASDCQIDDSKKANPLYLLRNDILKANNWAVVDVNWTEFEERGEQRNKWLQGEIENAFKS